MTESHAHPCYNCETLITVDPVHGVQAPAGCEGVSKGMSTKFMTNQRVVLLFASVGLLAGCAQLPLGAPTHAPPSVTVAGEPEPSRAPLPAAPVPATTQQQATKIAIAAAGMLESGHEEQAKTELQRALAADPNNKLALNLMRQITAPDPVAVLGRESFNYVVRPNDSMSGIAGRFLGDIYSFYILARYNGIAVPRLVSGGQVLRIPGKAPPPSVAREPARESPAASLPPPPPPTVVTAPPPPPEPTPGERAMRAAESAERAGDLDRALGEYRKAATLEQPGAEAKADQLRKQLVLRYSLNARTAMAKQDLDGAIRGWERVLAIDPNNDTAKLERQRALALKEKIKKL